MAELKTPFFNNINLDLVKTQAWVPQQVFATSGDTGYAQIFSLYENGSAYNDATTADLNFRALKADGNVVDITGGNGFKAMDNPNKFIFAIPAQTFAATGKVECYFYITNSDGSIVASTTHFYYQVLNSVPENTDSISYIASLNDVVKHAKDLEAQALGLISEITANKTATDNQSTDFAVDLKQKQSDAEKQVDQMLADAKKAMDASVGEAGNYKQKLNDLNDQYLAKYNELLAKLPDADTEVQRQISNALAKLQEDEQAQFQKIQMDWVKQKETLNSSIADYQNGIEKQLDQLKAQISNISGENVTKLAKQIDDLQTKLASMKLDEYYTKKEIDDKLADYQPSIDLSGYETTKHAEDTYAKKTDIVAPDLSGYETKVDADNTYAKKTDIPALPDMSDYAKKTDIPASPDLSSYETISHADSTYAKKTDIPDVSGFETKSDADATYAKKTDIPQGQDLSVYETKENAEQTYAKKADIPDVSGFATSADIDKTYETKADAANHLTKDQADKDYATNDRVNRLPIITGIEIVGNGVDVPAQPMAPHAQEITLNLYDFATANDLLQYAKKSDITSPDLTGYAKSEDIAKTYETKENADTTYAKKSDIPDVASYLTKTAADAAYLAKSDAANFATKDDLTGYVKKGDSTGSGSVDLSDYLKKSDANNTYIKGIRVVYNQVARQGRELQFQTKDLNGSNSNGYINTYIGAYAAFPITVNTSQYTESQAIALSIWESNYLIKNNDEYFLHGHRLLTDKNTNLSNFATKDDLKNIGSGSSSSDVKTINIESPNVSDPSATDVWGTIAIKPDSNGTVNVDRDTLYNAIFNHHSPVTSISVKASNGNTNTVDPDSVTGELQLDLSNYVSNTDLVNKKYIQMIDFTKGGAGYNAGTVETVNYSSGTTSNVMHIDLAKLSNLIAPDISTNAYNKSQTYSDSKSLSSTYANGQDLSNLAYPCVVDIDMVPGNFDETNDPKEFSKVNANVIVRRYGNYYLGGHKIQFAD